MATIWNIGGSDEGLVKVRLAAKGCPAAVLV
jgi:hypothetical protein